MGLRFLCSFTHSNKELTTQYEMLDKYACTQTKMVLPGRAV